MVLLTPQLYCSQNSASINPTLKPNVAHFLAILFTTVIFHLIDRNSEYIAKVDYKYVFQGCLFNRS